MNRLDHTLGALRRAGRSGLAAYFAAGDPDPEASLALLRGLPAAGADVIELGMPFSDPVADGPILQQSQCARAGRRANKRTLALVRALRETESRTPVVLMGYLNPILRHGVAAFAGMRAGRAWTG